MDSALRAGLALAPLLCLAVPSQADVITYRFIDVTDFVQFQILVNGSLTFTDTQGGESYSGTIPLVAALTAPLSLAANIFELGGGSISDVFSARGAAGGASIAAFFVSDTDGGPVLDPLPNAISLVENGDIQTVGSATVADGSTVTFQFQSDVVEVPEPSPVVPVMVLFIALLGRRGRQQSRRSPVLVRYRQLRQSAPDLLGWIRLCCLEATNGIIFSDSPSWGYNLCTGGKGTRR